LNLPKLELEAASPEKLRSQQHALYKSRTASRYSGVTVFPHAYLAWCAELRVGKRKYPLGYWETERAAAIAVDRARLFYAGGKETGRARLNFPKLSHRLVPADAATLRAEARAAFKARTTSRFRGVSRNSRTGRWVAAIMVNRKYMYLGNFDDEVEAALAYDRAAERLLGDRAKLNFQAHARSAAKQQRSRTPASKFSVTAEQRCWGASTKTGQLYPVRPWALERAALSYARAACSSS
jgi:AP2-like factor (euAP2 lineage)